MKPSVSWGSLHFLWPKSSSSKYWVVLSNRGSTWTLSWFPGRINRLSKWVCLAKAVFFCLKFPLNPFRFTSQQKNWLTKKLNNFEKLKFLNDEIYSCTKKDIWNLINWCFGLFHLSKIAITCSDMNRVSLLIHKIPLICYANRVAGIHWIKLLLWIRSHIQPHL